MMKLTARVKKWLIENCDVKSTATDDEFREAAGKALADGSLSMEKLTELTTTDEDKETNAFSKMMEDLTGAVKELQEGFKTLKSEKTPESEDEMTDEEKAAKAEADKKAAEEKAKKEAETKNKTHAPSLLEKAVVSIGMNVSGDDPDEEKTFNVRVKEAAEQYDDAKSALVYPSHTEKGRVHPLAGKPVKDFTGESPRTIDEASDRDKAVAGAFGKFMTFHAQYKSKDLAFKKLNQHEKELLCHAMENMSWGGASDGGNYADIDNRKLTPTEQKALIDDSTSGGLEAAPIVFDDQVIQTPLLNGELFPLVNIVPLTRGRRVEGVATGTVTGSWGGVDDTAISLFNTASYVSAFDTTIFRWEGAIRIGLDFLSDTPINFSAHITAQYGERLLEDLDDVVATGNGTTQPEGVMNKSGTTSVAFGGATSLGNYESLRFSVAKPEHRASVKASAVFCGNETSYQRARAIPVGASDARRLGGMDYDSYQWMERPYKINESMANTQLFYCILARYRMYRRRGLAMRSSTEGDTLLRNNELLMVAMARYGGQLERGATAGVTTTAEA